MFLHIKCRKAHPVQNSFEQLIPSSICDLHLECSVCSKIYIVAFLIIKAAWLWSLDDQRRPESITSPKFKMTRSYNLCNLASATSELWVNCFQKRARVFRWHDQYIITNLGCRRAAAYAHLPAAFHCFWWVGSCGQPWWIKWSLPVLQAPTEHEKTRANKSDGFTW